LKSLGGSVGTENLDSSDAIADWTEVASSGGVSAAAGTWEEDVVVGGSVVDVEVVVVGIDVFGLASFQCPPGNSIKSLPDQ
jgi:hypothetical protein